ncbi:MAG: hypothetical protein D6715_04170 [Calditrichaeota bacterium]|nr:MAG: hypothetical protein D6715_04170 [Calditrichota bacterium]
MTGGRAKVRDFSETIPSTQALKNYHLLFFFVLFALSHRIRYLDFYFTDVFFLLGVVFSAVLPMILGKCFGGGASNE